MENKSFIKSVRIKDLILSQLIDLDTDSVHFIHYSTREDLFIIDSSGYCDYTKPGVKEPIRIGKFGYANNECKLIKFTFNETFLFSNTGIVQKEFTTSTGDFIEAERTVIERLILNYPDVFTFSTEYLVK